uniref:Uncharacterized protein n=1 Tax=Solanum lycopersicum TaxID=4081 RepID=A0A3Q7HIX5_SOLLC
MDGNIAVTRHVWPVIKIQRGGFNFSTSLFPANALSWKQSHTFLSIHLRILYDDLCKLRSCDLLLQAKHTVTDEDKS